jgi:hypothetical protein
MLLFDLSSINQANGGWQWKAGGGPGSGVAPLNLQNGLANIVWTTDEAGGTTSGSTSGALAGCAVTWPYDQVTLMVVAATPGTFAGNYKIRVQWCANPSPLSSPNNAAAFTWVDDTYLVASQAGVVNTITPYTNEWSIPAVATTGDSPYLWTMPVVGMLMRVGVYCDAAVQASVTALTLTCQGMITNPGTQP